MDSTLLFWLNSRDEAESERLLSELIQVHTSPIIKQTLRRKLGFFINRNGANAQNPDAEDLYQDVLTRIVHRLGELKAQPAKKEIRNYQQFVVRVATNACHDYLRAKSPLRARLKNSLHDLLDRHRDFKIWRGKSGQLLCGFAEWSERRTPDPQSERLEQLSEHPGLFMAEKFSGEDLQGVSRAKLVAEVFKRINAPIELDVLVNLIAALLELKDQPVESLDEEDSDTHLRLVDRSIRSDALLEGRAELRRFWEELRGLTPRFREVVCLGFADQNGEDLISLLMGAEVVTLPDIATDLAIPLEQLQMLWARAPMDTEALAAHFGVTRRQVSRWRHRAWQQLAQRLMIGKAKK